VSSAPSAKPSRTARDGDERAARGRAARNPAADSPEPGPGTSTDSGLPLEPYYAANANGGARAVDSPPGEYPFTRGIRPAMYRERIWTMRQYAGTATAADSRERFLALLRHGQTGLSVAFDLPTQCGLDPDDPRAEGEVGQVGVSVATLADIEELFRDIPLERVSTSMTINATAAILLAMYEVAGEKRGVPAERLSGTLQNDILKEYVARGTYVFPLEPSLRLVADVIEYTSRRVPRFHPISVSGYHMREAGLDAPHEMAFTLANARCYVRSVLERGVPLDAFGPRISWIMATHRDLFEEVAKFRALRRMWARMARDEFGAQDPRSWMFRTHTQTTGTNLTRAQPENNIARAALQALAATLGGVQSLALSCYDEALAIPTEKTQQIALRTQQILAYETGVARVADPLGGSYLVEDLTDRLEREARTTLDEVEARGGARWAVESGYYHRAIADAAAREQSAVERGEKIVVGVNRFQDDVEPTPPPIFRPPPRTEEGRRRAVARARSERDAGAVRDALESLRGVARGRDNLMPAIVDAVRVYASVGEIVSALKDVFGEARHSTVV
jgi:methylmalonyl-CoA mutase N-terminal domain/subunit